MFKEKIKDILTLLRIRQYYKNGLIFVGAFFGKKLFSSSNFPILILGFVILCLVSSINYIINDIGDIEKDKHHPEKLEKKPLASGRISKLTAYLLLLFIILFVIVMVLFFIPNLGFTTMIILLIITGQSYNHFFKNFAFADILVLSLGYIWRSLSGCLLINVYISPWLFLAIFEIALFLVIAKRKGDLMLLGEEKAGKHKKSYDQYSLKLLEQFHIMIGGSLFITYSLYLIIRFDLFSSEGLLINDYLVFLTVPALLYMIMRYLYLINENSETARRAELIFFDKGIIIAVLFIGVILGYVFYFDLVLNLIDNYLFDIL
ncbi:MAG: UbiA prenyltransferase family protein [Promethearchaeia archaeon]